MSKLKSFMTQNYILILCSLGIMIIHLSKAQTKENSTSWSITNKMVGAHYVGWYGDSSSRSQDSLRHWKDGHVHSPMIGLYDSRRPSLLTYHLLTAWACGIDGFIFDWYGKESFENKSLITLKSVIDIIRNINSSQFHFSLIVCYDDQATGSLDSNLLFLRDSVIGLPSSYLSYLVIFIFNYPGYYSASDYRRKADSIFSTPPVLVWNESQQEVFPYVDGCYPWVQPSDTNGDGYPDWDSAGKNWGKSYLGDFYWRVNNLPQLGQLRFACSGVWPGFDDRPLTWGQNRWMDRQDGKMYDSTWNFVHTYTYPLLLPWVQIETWNDFNEGTEIEATKEDRYKYLLATKKNIGKFKNISIDQIDTSKFVEAERIYYIHRALEKSKGDSAIFDPSIDSAIARFFDTPTNVTSNRQYNTLPVEFALQQNYPNPFNPSTTIGYELPKNAYVTLIVYDLLGRPVETLVNKLQSAGNHSVRFNGTNLPSGIYFYRLQAGTYYHTMKLLLLK